MFGSALMKAPLQTLPPDLISLADYARLSEDFIAPATRAWLEGGSGQLQALTANRASFTRYSIYNRILCDLRSATTAISLLGIDLAHPILLAPLGYHRLVHPQGEIATARGALDTLCVVSSMASVSMEAIAQAAVAPLWFQLYFQPNSEDTLRLIRRAEAVGYRAIMVTLDTPIQPASHAALKAGFAIPDDIEAVHLLDNQPLRATPISEGQSAIFHGMMAQAFTADDLQWLRDATRLPILAKGVTHPKDALALSDMGFDGIVVSNHGGRALDCAPAPLDVLPAIRTALGPDATILIDGGIRRGSDIFKAIALGANAVMIGRPQLHALSVAGSLGVAHMLKLLRDDLELVMALAGTPTIAAITADTLFRNPGFGSEAPC